VERTIRSQQAPEERNSLAQRVSAGELRHREEPHRGGTNQTCAASSGAGVILHGYPALTRWANELRPSGPSTEELFHNSFLTTIELFPDQGSLSSQGSLFYNEAFLTTSFLLQQGSLSRRGLSFTTRFFFKASALSKATGCD
jgi:hypothetical protein